jgi:hypothetical protein
MIHNDRERKLTMTIGRQISLPHFCGDIFPHRVQQRLFLDCASAMLDQMDQGLKRFGSQVHSFLTAKQGVQIEVQVNPSK